MLVEMFLEQKKLYESLNDFSIRVEEVSYIFKKLILENNNYIINIMIEDYEQYVSVILEKKNSKKIYYALADFSFLPNSKEMFEFITSLKKDEYYIKLKKVLKQKSKRKNNNKEKQLSSLIYLLLESFFLDNSDE